jgi:hypothetical protein
MENASKSEMSPMLGINSLTLNMTGRPDRSARSALPYSLIVFSFSLFEIPA